MRAKKVQKNHKVQKVHKVQKQVENTEKIDDYISDTIINNVKKYFNKHYKGKGLWYPEDYFKNLRRKGIKVTQDDIQRWYDGLTNEDFFDKIGPFTFKVKKNVSPSDAVLAFLEGPTVADCGNATQTIYYKTFIDLYGPELFDELYQDNLVIKYIMDNPVDREVFKSEFKSNFCDSSKTCDTNSASNSANTNLNTRTCGDASCIMENNPGCLGNRPLKIGDHLHFGCVKWYTNKHPAGFGGGWNVIYGGRNEKGEQIFQAHGFDKPLTEKEINNLCVKDYNVKRTKKDFQYIKDENRPDLYSQKTNKWLTDYYKIDQSEMEKDPEKFLEGYLHDTRIRL